MRLDTAREETITNLSGSRKFKMKPSAKAFQIVSSGIYERKIEAIIRELSCNASDSHTQAGKADVPFRVQMPTVMNDYIFAVEDFGVGLSEEEVYNVYTTYFESTKTDSNDVIGALGLGSKSPFSYTDSFTIKARKDGRECVFSAQISASGEPEVVKMYDRPWAGGNGVEVSVEVAHKDVHEFYSSACKILSWFPVKPECNKEIRYEVDQSVVDNVRQYGYHLDVQNNGWGSRTDCRVIMGSVAYSLNLDNLGDDEEATEDFKSFIQNLKGMKANVYFEVAIGDADVTASRETLSLDDRTRANLRAKLMEIHKNFYETTVEKVSKMNNIFEAYSSLTNYERGLVKDIDIGGYTLAQLRPNITTPFDAERDQAGKIVSAVDRSLMDVYNTYDIGIYGSFGKRYGTLPRSKRDSSCRWGSLVSSHDGYKMTVVINDCERKMGLKDALGQANLPEYVIVVTDKNTTLTTDLEKVISRITLGCYKIVYASSFWDGKLSDKKSTSGGLAQDIILAKNVKVGGFSSFNRSKVDFSTENADNWAYAAQNGEFAGLEGISGIFTAREVKDMAEELGLDGVILYNGLTEKKVKRNVNKELGALVKAKATKASVVRAIIASELQKQKGEPITMLKGFKDLVEFSKPEDGDYPKCSMAAAQGMDGRAEKRAIKTRIAVMEETIQSLRNSNKILNTLLTWRNYDSTMESEVKEYIEFLNRKEK